MKKAEQCSATANSRRCATDLRGMQSCSCKHLRRPSKTKRRVSCIKPPHRPNTVTSRRVKTHGTTDKANRQVISQRAEQKAAVFFTRLKTETLTTLICKNVISVWLACVHIPSVNKRSSVSRVTHAALCLVGLSAACTAEDVVQLTGRSPAILDSLIHKSNAVRPPPKQHYTLCDKTARSTCHG